MDMKCDYVEYENQIFRIHEIMKKLGLSMSTYRKYRLEQIDPQEAFEKCLLNLPDKVMYQNEMVVARKMIKELNLGLRTYERKRKAGFSAQEAFDYVLNQKIQNKKMDNSNIRRENILRKVRAGKKLDDAIKSSKEIKDVATKRYQNYISRGLPPTYKSLHAYCLEKSYDFRRLIYLLEKYPNFTIQEAEKFLQIGGEKYNGSLKYTAYGISFKSLCLKYGYSYDTCLDYFKETNDVFLAFLYYEVIREGIPFKKRSNVRNMIPFLLDMGENQVSHYLSFFGIPMEFLPQMLNLRNTAIFLKSEFFYYEINYLLEVQWEGICESELLAIDGNDEQKKRKIKERFRRQVLQLLQFGSAEKEQLRNVYRDLVSVQYQNELIWKKRKREISEI